MTKETRAGAPAEIRETEADGVQVAGYAAIYDEWADIGGYFQERIAPGAFEGRLGDDVQFLVNHRDLPLARTTAGTLQLSLDDKGLRLAATLDPSDPDAARIIPKLRRGDLSKMSFAFRVAEGGEVWDESGDVPRRTITRVAELIDVAVVNVPAYGGTEIGLRGLEAHRANHENSQDARVRVMRMDLALVGLS